mgnify:CR=1 FL=1
MNIFKKITLASILLTMTTLISHAAEGILSPPEIWKNYDPDKGDFKEEIIKEETKKGIYYKESYISAYVLGDEVRVFCKYSVKEGAKSAPGLLNVHGWFASPRIPQDYVNEGWAVLAHDYAGKLGERQHYTKYPEKLAHGNMDPSPVWLKYKNGEQITDPKQPSDYLWNAIQRRALSYLLAQKEVDKKRIAAIGYSYGGTIMWNLGMDPRVKAVVAYYGVGWNNYYRGRRVWKYNTPYVEPEKSQAEKIFIAGVAPQAHCPHITAATLWLNGSNDHHGGHERGQDSFAMFKPGVPWDFAVQARGHHNTEKLGDDCKLWLEKHVLNKDIFWPERPKSELKLDADGVPEIHLTPASPDRIKELQVYQCLKTANNIERVWYDVKSVRKGNTWIAKLPVVNINDYLFTYANIRYTNDCVVSSDFEAAIPAKLGKAIATEKKSDVLPEGVGQWSNVAPAEGLGGVKGFRPVNNSAGTTNLQFSDPKYSAPVGSKLKFMFYCTQPQKIVLTADKWYSVEIDITASDEWQSKTLKIDQLKNKNDGRSLGDWSQVKKLQITPQKGSDLSKVVFARFKWITSASQ